MSVAGVVRVAIQGERGSFSHAAVVDLVGEDAEVVPQSSFDALFDAVLTGKADQGLVPIENSLTGSIHENYDRLKAHPVHIVGETQLQIRQCLITRPGASLASIRRVSSHPVALAQCRRFFTEHPQLEPVVAYDTAGSVKDLLRDGPAARGAVASALAARLYGGQVLLAGIQDDPENFTRFLQVAREAERPPGADKTSVVFTLRNVPGALHQALGVFAGRRVDLSRIESRPLRGRPWEYAFYVDVLGDPAGAAGQALDELAALAADLRVFGSYRDGLRGRPRTIA